MSSVRQETGQTFDFGWFFTKSFYRCDNVRNGRRLAISGPHHNHSNDEAEQIAKDCYKLLLARQRVTRQQKRVEEDVRREA
jgi:hypothetical protein